MLPNICAELKDLLEKDDGTLFGKQIKYDCDQQVSSSGTFSSHTVVLGNSFIKTDDVYSSVTVTETVKHNMRRLESSVSIGIKHCTGIFKGKLGDDPLDYIILRISAVDEFVAAKLPKIIGFQTGSAKLYSLGESFSRAFTNEQEICRVLNYLKGLDGNLTAQSLIENLDAFISGKITSSEEKQQEPKGMSI